MSKKPHSTLMLAVVATGLLGHVSPAAGQILPAARLTTWNPGIPGGIPARTTICANVNAATYGNGTQDATAGIQNAVDLCPVGQVVLLSAGDFKITGTVEIKKGIVLRGQGPALTKLKMPVGTNSGLIVVGTRWFKFTQSVNLAADAVKGANSVTLASFPSGLAVGEIVAVDQTTDTSMSDWGSNCTSASADCRLWFTRPNRPLGQVLEVASVSGNTVSFTTPFHIAFKTAFGAQLSRFSNTTNGAAVPSVKYAGVEDLYLYGGSQGQGNIALENAAYSWIKNIESTYHEGDSVAFNGSFRCVIRDSYIYTTQTPSPGGGGYGLSFAFYSSDNLFENNIVWNMNKVMVMRASGGGNVIGYNYMEDGWIDYDPTWVETGLNASHMTTPHYELFEGNQSFNFDGDNTWGNALYITVFRNHLTAKRRSVSPLSLNDQSNRRAIGLMTGHMYYSFVGNVLGTPGITGYTNYEDAFPWDDNGLWRLGYNPENWNAAADPRVVTTLLRGGNFDYVTNQVHWENVAQQTLPNSLYLTGKPAFLGNDPWPWVDPTGTTKLYTLPARARFDQLRGPTKFYTVTPCRLVDTRNAVGPQGGPALVAAKTRDFQASGLCGVPTDARAVAANVTVVTAPMVGYLTVFPPGSPQSTTSNINFNAGNTKANNLVVGLATSGAVGGQAVSVFCGIATGQMHFIMDVVGYYK